MPRRLPFALAALVVFGVPFAAPAADDDELANVPSQDLKAGGDADKRYFLVGPPKGDKAPKGGYGLVVVLPGGDGSAEFHPFVKSIYKFALKEKYLVAQPVARKWADDQEIVWPTARAKQRGAKFTTEQFVAAVVADVGKKHQLAEGRVFTLSWSSGGPAAYAVSLDPETKVAGSLVAMSVFRPNDYPNLKAAKGHAYYLYHSPDDRVCPYRMARNAKDVLAEKGAAVELVDYQGGHGWRENPHQAIEKGVAWLEKNRGDPKKGG